MMRGEVQTVKNRRRSLIALAAFFLLLLIAMVALVPLSGWISSFRPYQIPSTSMEPTIFHGDHVLVNEHYYRKHPMKDGDIIAFRHGDYTLLKRISALPGESIEGKDGVLFRNGQALIEPYAVHSKENPIPQIETFERRVIPEGEIFVTGDSRDMSLDSRSKEFGAVQTSDVVGKLVWVYLSSHAGQTGHSF